MFGAVIKYVCSCSTIGSQFTVIETTNECFCLNVFIMSYLAQAEKFNLGFPRFLFLIKLKCIPYLGAARLPLLKLIIPTAVTPCNSNTKPSPSGFMRVYPY